MHTLNLLHQTKQLQVCRHYAGLHKFSRRQTFPRNAGCKLANIGALRITYTILGAPYHNYSLIYPKSPILIIKAISSMAALTHNLDCQRAQKSASTKVTTRALGLGALGL